MVVLGRAPGTATITVRSQAEPSANATITATVAAIGLRVVGGDNQTGVAGGALPAPLVVEVFSVARGQVADDRLSQQVDFTIESGGG